MPITMTRQLKLSKILSLEGFRLAGYISIDGSKTYICFNECAYAHLLMKDHVIQNIDKTDDLVDHIKFYLRIHNNRLCIDRVDRTYLSSRGGFHELVGLSSKELDVIVEKINESLIAIDTIVSFDPYVNIHRAIIWDRYELKQFEVENLKDYYSGHELTYDNLY